MIAQIRKQMEKALATANELDRKVVVLTEKQSRLWKQVDDSDDGLAALKAHGEVKTLRERTEERREEARAELKRLTESFYSTCAGAITKYQEDRGAEAIERFRVLFNWLPTFLEEHAKLSEDVRLLHGQAHTPVADRPRPEALPFHGCATPVEAFKRAAEILGGTK